MQMHIAIDIGSESGRITVGYLKDGKVVTEELHRFPTLFMRAHGKNLRNIYRYHEEIIRGLKKYVNKYGSELASIGVDSWGGDFVLLNRQGEICGLPASYRDISYGTDAERIIEKKIGLEKVYRKTGNQTMPTDTLNQLVRLREAHAPSLDDPRGILFMGDVYHYLLGAKPCCEHSLASYSRMYNQTHRKWDEEILQCLELPKEIQTEITYAGDDIGCLDDEIRKEVGLTGETRIITPCTHDTACAALAVPDEGDEWAFLSSGTWSLLGFETVRPIITDSSYKYNFSNSSMGFGINMFKKNIQGMWLIQQCAQIWKHYSYEEIVRLAEKETTSCYIDGDREEFYAPENMAQAISFAVRRDFGVIVDANDVGKISRICFESLALKYRYYLDKLIETSGKKISRIHVLGGGSKNRLLNQFTANATGYPVYTGVYEGSNIGNILLQSYGCGELKGKEELRGLVCRTFKKEVFYPEQRNMWEEKYQAFLCQVSHKAQW